MCPFPTYFLPRTVSGVSRDVESCHNMQGKCSQFSITQSDKVSAGFEECEEEHLATTGVFQGLCLPHMDQQLFLFPAETFLTWEVFFFFYIQNWLHQVTFSAV